MASSSLTPINLDDQTSMGISEFLNTLPEDEVHGLLKTTTGGLIAASTVAEAISIIIRYSDAVTLLNRKRVKKEYLVGYLHLKNVKFLPSADKTKLCRIILNHWGEENTQALKFIDSTKERKSSINAADPTLVHANNARKFNSNSNAQCTSNKPSTSNSQPQQHNFSKKHENLSKGYLLQKNISQPQTCTNSNSINTTDDGSKSKHDSLNQQLATINNHSVTSNLSEDEEEMDFEESISLRKAEAHLGQQLAQEFSSWFYERLNSLSDFGSNHFWPECNLRTEFITNNVQQICEIQEVTHDGQKCFEQICEVRNKKQLYFNPNLMPGLGVRGKINPHGLAQIMVCGTLHQEGNVFGVFEQVFGLMRDPGADNTFKIKFCMLKLREGNEIINGNNPPSLCDSSLVGILEEVDED